jgi:EAL domain-containing protein (putative c-di-GMP-specific phosphodiesterase class I)
MAEALGIYATAEGVETSDQLAGLKKLGCSRVQGFIFARPMPGAAIDKLIAVSHHWPDG